MPREKSREPGSSRAIYYRIQNSRTQTEEISCLQETSGELWGTRGRYNARPTVRAYLGRLPEDDEGIEFETAVSPDPNGVPILPTWTGPREGVRVEGPYAKINIRVRRNTQCQ